MRAWNCSTAGPCRINTTVCLSYFSWYRSSYIPGKPSKCAVLPWFYLNLREHWETSISFNQRESQWLRLDNVLTLWNQFNYSVLICRDRKQVILVYRRDSSISCHDLQPLVASDFPEYLQENHWEKSHGLSSQVPIRLMMMMMDWVCKKEIWGYDFSLNKFIITKLMDFCKELL